VRLTFGEIAVLRFVHRLVEVKRRSYRPVDTNSKGVVGNVVHIYPSLGLLQVLPIRKTMNTREVSEHADTTQMDQGNEEQESTYF
jgi:hypothetical protein